MDDSDVEPSTHSVDPNRNTHSERDGPPDNVGLPPQISPPEEHKSETTTCKPDQTPLWKIVLEVGAVAVGIAVAMIYYGQLDVMRGQLGEIVKQYPEIKKSSQAAVDNAGAARDAATAAKISAEISERQVRAYVTLHLKGAQLTNVPQRKMFLGALVFYNSGQSIASDVVTLSASYIGRFYDDISKNCRAARRLQIRKGLAYSKSIMSPQGEIQITVVQADSTGNTWASVQAGTHTVCAFGSVFYTDIFKIAHETEYCLYWLNGGAWADCAEHNKAYDYPAGTSPYPK